MTEPNSDTFAVVKDGANEVGMMNVRAKRRASIAITFSLLVFGMGQSFIFTSIPPIARELGWSESRVGLIMMSGALVLVCFSFFWGRWVDRLGTRRSMQAGMLAYALTTLGLGVLFAGALDGKVASSATFLLAIGLRVVFSATSGGVFPSAQAYFVATSTPETRTSAIATIGIAFSVGMTMGPALAATVSNLSLYAPFYAMAFLAFASTVLLHFCGPKSQDHRANSSNPESQVEPIKWLTHPAFPFLLLIMIVSLVLNGTQQVVVFFVQDLLNLSAKEAAQRGGISMTIMSIVMIVVQIVVAQRLKLDPALMINLGGATLLASMSVFTLYPSWFSFLVAMALFGGGVGLLYPAIIAFQTLSAAPVEQARVAGVNVSSQGVGLVLGPVSASYLYQLSALYPFLLVGFLAILIIAVFNLCTGSKESRA
ncbi:MAG: MFS transporter [Pseudomonadota bacterium]